MDTYTRTLLVPVFVNIANPFANFVSKYDIFSTEIMNLEKYLAPMSQTSVHAKYFPLFHLKPVLFITALYLAMVIGLSWLMKNVFVNVKFQLKYYSLVHNAAMVLISGFMVYEAINQAVLNSYSLMFNGLDESSRGLGMASVLWLFFFSKILEFNDTLIMILKRNFRQVTFLHVYHHMSVFLYNWMINRLGSTGDGKIEYSAWITIVYIAIFLNSFVHVLMYGYYFGAALKIKQVSIIKHNITFLQLTQFVINFVHAIVLEYYSFTAYPPLIYRISFFYMISLMILFGNFLIKDKNRIQKNKVD